MYDWIQPDDYDAWRELELEAEFNEMGGHDA